MDPGKRLTLKNIYVAAALVFILTAWFSVGYNHFDEHFQVIEFAGMKLGLTEKANLPWEYACMMRPAIQPLVVYCLYSACSGVGVTNPFFIAFLLRLLSAGLAFYSIHLVIRLYSSGFTGSRMLPAFLVLSFFLWFVPYNGARFSSETVSGRVFLIGLALLFLKEKPKPLDYLVTGLIIGVSFIIRYQVAFMVIGFAAWLVFVNRAGFVNILLFGAGIVAAFLAGVLTDYWFYGKWVLTSWNYFEQNLLLGKAAGFGTYPWWYYIWQTFMNALPPLSLVYILAVFFFFLYFPKDIITWTLVPFLAAHFIIGHKEIRFLFPVIGFLPVMIIRMAEVFQHRYRDWLTRHGQLAGLSVKLFWTLNTMMLAVLMFRPADDQIGLYQTLWNDYPGPARLCFTGDNPYHRAKVDIHFYKRAGLSLQKVDSVQQIVPLKDTAVLLVTTHPLKAANLKFKPVQVYASFPQWVTHFNINHWIERTSFWYIYEVAR